jgi:arylsulfatase
MPKDLKPILARQMEIYAAFLEHTDHHLGRLVDGLKDLGVLDDTLVMFIIGDNGASAEGSLNGTFNEAAMLNGMAAVETVEFLKSKIDDFGGPKAYNHYAVGWAHAMDTPYQWTKQLALGRYAKWHHCALAAWHQGERRGPLAVSSCHRCSADDFGSRGATRTHHRQQRAASAPGGCQHAVCLRQRQGRRTT